MMLLWFALVIICHLHHTMVNLDHHDYILGHHDHITGNNNHNLKSYYDNWATEMNPNITAKQGLPRSFPNDTHVHATGPTLIPL